MKKNTKLFGNLLVLAIVVATTPDMIHNVTCILEFFH